MYTKNLLSCAPAHTLASIFTLINSICVDPCGWSYKFLFNDLVQPSWIFNLYWKNFSYNSHLALLNHIAPSPLLHLLVGCSGQKSAVKMFEINVLKTLSIEKLYRWVVIVAKSLKGYMLCHIRIIVCIYQYAHFHCLLSFNRVAIEN